ncbi:MAG: hypothetical protein ACTSQY_00025 [Candidatus Odinarchaeia archaeon]|nr:MAG: hypothetical protein [Lokiarchaeota virus Fenrir Meg22_1012]URC17183.1 MAG: hypothetical protein [Lokiarchaeota virus Fenrir Meg22_1214]
MPENSDKKPPEQKLTIVFDKNHYPYIVLDQRFYSPKKTLFPGNTFYFYHLDNGESYFNRLYKEMFEALEKNTNNFENDNNDDDDDDDDDNPMTIRFF